MGFSCFLNVIVDESNFAIHYNSFHASALRNKCHNEKFLSYINLFLVTANSESPSLGKRDSFLNEDFFKITDLFIK